MSSETESRSSGRPHGDPELDDFEKELDTFIEEKSREQNKSKAYNDEERDRPEKGQQETQGTEKKKTFIEGSTGTPSDNDDSEPDDYSITDDQRRALDELEKITGDMGFPDEEPPEYDVKERLKELNKELANDPTPLEKQGDSRVVFKSNLVDLVAPPPDFSDDEDKNPGQSSPNTQTSQDKKTASTAPSGDGSGKKEKVLIEREGQFELVNADDVTANDLGLSPASSSSSSSSSPSKSSPDKKRENQRTPAPPGQPRPATANGNTRRSLRVTSAKQRPKSAGTQQNRPVDLSNLENYESPYGLTAREKELQEERRRALEKKKKDDERKQREDEERKQKENEEAFNYWLKKKREDDRRKKIQEEEERRQKEKADRDDVTSEQSENEEAFKAWLKEKHTQQKKEKLLKKRQDQEMHDGYYVRSREECDRAYKEWMKHKAAESRKSRSTERQRAKMHRLAARRSRRSQSMAKAIRQSQAFRYVDYYGYRF